MNFQPEPDKYLFAVRSGAGCPGCLLGCVIIIIIIIIMIIVIIEVLVIIVIIVVIIMMIIIIVIIAIIIIILMCVSLKVCLWSSCVTIVALCLHAKNNRRNTLI